LVDVGSCADKSIHTNRRVEEVNSEPVCVSIEGEWTTNGNTYTLGGSSLARNIKEEMGIGILTLAN
jgi:hypothetical protein